VISYLDRLKAKIQEKHLPEEVPKVPKVPFGTFGTLHGRPISQTDEPARYPLGYTEAEMEAARRDAERLGYGRGRTVH